MTAEEIEQTLESYAAYRRPRWTDPTPGWTDERVEILKKLWAEGLSSSQIAARLGAVTRNGIIGKIHRLGLSGRVQLSKSAYTSNPRQKRGSEGRQNTALAKAAAKRISKPVAPIPPPEPVGPFAEIDVPLFARKQLLDRTDHEDRTLCRWIIGDPKTPDHHYCHHQRGPVGSYCSHHAQASIDPRLRYPSRMPFLRNVRPYPTHWPEDIARPEPEIKVA